MLRAINYELSREKNQVLNTLPRLQRTHSEKILTTTRGKRYEDTKPLKIRRCRFELASLRNGKNYASRIHYEVYRYVNTRSTPKYNESRCN